MSFACLIFLNSPYFIIFTVKYGKKFKFELTIIITIYYDIKHIMFNSKKKFLFRIYLAFYLIYLEKTTEQNKIINHKILAHKLNIVQDRIQDLVCAERQQIPKNQCDHLHFYPLYARVDFMRKT
ncbi:hypothetical protein BpHYR1_049326 [Brachionus plicatilis]|uniref:Uncharacterized protein n=1 Tax=Brachionus plicatilis TaxID=10195 RepID=A0A3M7SG02_BRAPC|nr:hypothetical protein BpHYR1_049326 [Brachionus plicatilis]